MPRLDQNRPCEITRPWWPASGARQRARRSRAESGSTQRRFTGVSPGGGVSGNQSKREQQLTEAGEHAHTIRRAAERHRRWRRDAVAGGGRWLAGVRQRRARTCYEPWIGMLSGYSGCMSKNKHDHDLWDTARPERRRPRPERRRLTTIAHRGHTIRCTG
jgi:hypothetical protein